MANEIQKSITIKDYLSAPAVQTKMKEMLVSPDMIRQFTTSVISLSGADELLATAEPRSLFNAALTAASMNLPINKNLGFAHIIGYKNNSKGGQVEAQFQMGARGFKELAQRSGRYLIINEGIVKKGEVKSRNRLTGEVEWGWIDDDIKREKLPTVGYFSYFKLDNGFESTLYWTVDEVKAHAKQFSQSYKRGFGPWKDMFDAMAKKTVMKLNISKNGPLDINLQQAVTVDQGVIKDDGAIDYIDGEVVDESNELPELAIEEIKKAKSAEELSSIVDELTVDQRKAAVPYVNERMSELTTKPTAKK